MRSPVRALLLPCLVMLMCTVPSVHCWQWSDLFSGAGDALATTYDTLTMDQVSEMRVRDIKRRLARTHGFSAEELNRMLDKKELIHALAFEEHKVYREAKAEFQRQLFYQGVVITAIVGVITFFWPLLRHAFVVAQVNLEVYTDRKRLEARRCWELRSFQGCLGVFCMFVIDILSIWLTVSVLLSWVMTSRYFFPTPSIPIRPAQLMGGEVANGPMAKYGINVGPMILTWGFRFLQGKLEAWVGRALSKAHRAQTKKSRKDETPEEREARRVARRARRAAREEEKQRQQQKQQQNAFVQGQEVPQDEPVPVATAGAESTNPAEPTVEEKRRAAAFAAEARLKDEAESMDEGVSALDELD